VTVWYSGIALRPVAYNVTVWYSGTAVRPAAYSVVVLYSGTASGPEAYSLLVWYSGTAVRPTAHSVAICYSGIVLLQLRVWHFCIAAPLYVLQLTTVRVPNQQHWTFYPAVTWSRDGVLTV